MLFGGLDSAAAAATTIAAAVATAVAAMTPVAATVATIAAVAAMTAVAATAVAGAMAAVAAMAEGRSLVFNAHQGDADQREKHRETEHNNSIHPQILQLLTGTVSGK